MSRYPDETTFGPAEICLAIGVPRATLHSWLARRYIPVESSGTGTERQLSFEQVVWLAVIAEMTSNRIASGTAAGLVEQVRAKLGEALRRDYAKNISLIVAGGKARLRHRTEPAQATALMAKERFYSALLLDRIVQDTYRELNDIGGYFPPPYGVWPT